MPRGAGWWWTIVAAVVGFVASMLLATALDWSRNAFIGAWLLLAAGVLVAYTRSSGTDFAVQLRRRWLSGLVIGIAVGALLARGVSRQPSSARPEGMGLVAALLWQGLAYGAVDALMLTILPVLTIYGARPASELSRSATRLRWAVSAFAGSLAVTAAYHAGFREFQGTALLQPLIGNAVITLAYLASGSPLAPLVAHVAMHAAAVVHGAATALQLPPH